LNQQLVGRQSVGLLIQSTFLCVHLSRPSISLSFYTFITIIVYLLPSLSLHLSNCFKSIFLSLFNCVEFQPTRFTYTLSLYLCGCLCSSLFVCLWYVSACAAMCLSTNKSVCVICMSFCVALSVTCASVSVSLRRVCCDVFSTVVYLPTLPSCNCVPVL
jgi:hypothetical protein